MKCLIDTRDKSKGGFLEQELTEEQFFEQFAALEEGLALLQIHMRGMSENAKLFGSLARHMRRSIYLCNSITRSTKCTDDRSSSLGRPMGSFVDEALPKAQTGGRCHPSRNDVAGASGHGARAASSGRTQVGGHSRG